MKINQQEFGCTIELDHVPICMHCHAQVDMHDFYYCREQNDFICVDCAKGGKEYISRWGNINYNAIHKGKRGKDHVDLHIIKIEKPNKTRNGDDEK